MFQAYQHADRKLMPFNTHHMGQGTQQQANSQINFRGEKR